MIAIPKSLPKDLDSLSFKQLTALQIQIEDLKTRKHDEAVAGLQGAEAKALANLSQKLAKMAIEAGVKLETVPLVATNGQHKTRKAGKQKVKSVVAPKYRDPTNPQNTWTGRGRQPRWMTATGKQPEAFRITA